MDATDCTGPCEGSCNHVTGCDKCQAGKKMPNCKRDCSAGSYGVNCAERCSQHCAAGSASCDRVTGACSRGCQQWYGLNTCKSEITQVPPGLESHYQYVVEAADGQSTKRVTKQFVAGQGDQSVEIKGLKHNTDYYIKVRIDARHNNQKRQGYAGQPLTLKTKNTEAPVTTTKATVATTKVTVATTKATVATSKATVPATKGPTSGTQIDDSDSTGVIIGVVMALVVLIVIVIVVVVVFVRLRKKDGMCKRTASPGRRPPLVGVENPPNDIVGVINEVAQDEGELDQEEEEVERVNPVPEEGVYMNLVHASTMVQVDKLEAYIKERNTIRDGFVPEYNKLPRTDMNKVKTAKLPDNVPLNRFKNIWPYDHSRVKLQMDDDHPSDYINACYITGYKDKANTYIACQGPRQNTLSDMWRMIWQLKITRIVMVTQLSESGRRKCDIYWPLTVGTQKVYGRVTVVTLSCDVYADYTIRTFQLTCEEGSRKVTHFQYTSWVDRGVPKYTYPLLALRRLIRSYDKHSSGPMVVHCSAGVGRTGTFIALDSLLDQAEAERQVDVYRFVNHMRTERMDMVQTQVQYVFLYHALLDGLKTGHLAYPSGTVPRCLQETV
ncbi:hypothetical protein LSAT2_030224 [Lamellibrachia satsuma]|nr:hypothetical protein LSAT2_030224 [Lamellibrachia satsuma]